MQFETITIGEVAEGLLISGAAFTVQTATAAQPVTLLVHSQSAPGLFNT